MKFFSNTLLWVSLLTLAACASNEPTISTDYDPDADYSQLRTYQWYGDVYNSKEEEFRRHNGSYKRIRSTIDDYLLSRGFRESKQGTPDFLINYNVSTRNKVKIDQFARYPEGGVHGAVSTGTYGSAVAIGYSTPNNGIRTYKEGTAVIDIIHFNSHKLIWRGIAEGRMSKEVDFSQRRRVAREIVDMLLSQFPPPKK